MRKTVVRMLRSRFASEGDQSVNAWRWLKHKYNEPNRSRPMSGIYIMRDEYIPLQSQDSERGK